MKYLELQKAVFKIWHKLLKEQMKIWKESYPDEDEELIELNILYNLLDDIESDIKAYKQEIETTMRKIEADEI